MLTAIAQSVEVSTLKTRACLPIEIRIRRSMSGHTVRLRNAMASASQTSEVTRRCWRAFPRYVTCAPMLIVLVPLCEAEPIAEFQDVNGNLAPIASRSRKLAVLNSPAAEDLANSTAIRPMVSMAARVKKWPSFRGVILA